MHKLLTEKEAAALVGLSHRTLQGMRARGSDGVGPRFVRLTAGGKFGAIRYTLADLESWVAERRRATADGAAQPDASESDGNG